MKLFLLHEDVPSRVFHRKGRLANSTVNIISWALNYISIRGFRRNFTYFQTIECEFFTIYVSGHCGHLKCLTNTQFLCAGMNLFKKIDEYNSIFAKEQFSPNMWIIQWKPPISIIPNGLVLPYFYIYIITV